MHFDLTEFPEEYTGYIRKKTLIIVLSCILMLFLVLISIAFGSVFIPLDQVLKSLLNMSPSAKWNAIILNIRLPRILTALIAGMGLAVSGTAMQSLLGNPLGSPFTLGISQAAAFGAALSVMVFGSGVMGSTSAAAVTITNPFSTSLWAFIFCLITTAVLVGITRLKQASPLAMILTGVALGSLFQSGTMFLQFFADDVQLAAMVFWTFGDAGRTSWQELQIISITVGGALIFFFTQRWRYNALDAGPETARSIGVNVEATRIIGMIVSSLVTSVIISYIGIIGFIGLVSPHIVRRIIGDDHRFLLPASALAGGILLLGADTLARTIMIPHVFPVSILTSFLGVPVFVYLIIKGNRR